ncbi:lymphocyte antigen 6E isoform X2 [Phacochoerus africanus]|uniref:lymphocyte antigen 6E isoform X2 n=1 Tax=Phacochoerus africanus TaxID=41426 RepID=UPI001FD95A30|nr:lymphocyte antigen 6E isoform X2 [Phacochoerus africanus]XP_047639066.1 lymphocyte antigen 6E isoform X2 [Phacochoerus africanus]
MLTGPRRPAGRHCGPQPLPRSPLFQLARAPPATTPSPPMGDKSLAPAGVPKPSSHPLAALTPLCSRGAWRAPRPPPTHPSALLRPKRVWPPLLSLARPSCDVPAWAGWTDARPGWAGSGGLHAEGRGRRAGPATSPAPARRRRRLADLDCGLPRARARAGQRRQAGDLGPPALSPAEGSSQLLPPGASCKTEPEPQPVTSKALSPPTANGLCPRRPHAFTPTWLSHSHLAASLCH